MKKIQNFFWICSGSDRALLSQCPSEGSKYAGIGATIFFTGLFAALAGFYAFYSVFDNAWVAALVGVVWGTMIFNLDRYIVSSMRKKSTFLDEFKVAIPRIILAIMIAMVISKPLEMKIFDKEIEAEIALMEQEHLKLEESMIRDRHQPLIDSLRRDTEKLKAEVVSKTAIRDTLRLIAQAEADGTGGSKRRNAGPIYRIKKADADRVEAELQEVLARNHAIIDSNQQRIASIESQIDDEINSRDAINLSGLASRLEALSRISAESAAIWLANWFIILLFIAIETAPVFVKLISEKGPYDFVLQAEEYDFKAESVQSLTKSNVRVKKRAQKMPNSEKEFVFDQLDMGIDRV